MVFQSQEFGEVRSIMINNEPWFMLVDICRVLDINNSRQAKTRLNARGVITNDVTLLNGYKKDGTPTYRTGLADFINESNLYKLIFQSRKPQAERFTDWVTDEVLPSIRKTGSYQLGQNEKKIVTLKFRQRPIRFLMIGNKYYYEPYDLSTVARKSTTVYMKDLPEEYIYRMDNLESKELNYGDRGYWCDKYGIRFVSFRALPNIEKSVWGISDFIDWLSGTAINKLHEIRGCKVQPRISIRRYDKLKVLTPTDFCMLTNIPMEYVHYALDGYPIVGEKLVIYNDKLRQFIKDNDLPEPQVNYLELFDYACCNYIVNSFKDRSRYKSIIDSIFDIENSCLTDKNELNKIVDKLLTLDDIRNKCTTSKEKDLMEELIDIGLKQMGNWDEFVPGMDLGFAKEKGNYHPKDYIVNRIRQLVKDRENPTIANTFKFLPKDIIVLDRDLLACL